MTHWWQEDQVRVHYYTFWYRKDLNDPGRLYITRDPSKVPDASRLWMADNVVVVPRRIWAEKGFDLLEFLQATRRM